MIKNVIRFGVLVGAGAALVLGWRDIRRFVKIKQVSGIGMHPEMVPASGRTVYPKNAGDGERDGTGDFDSARRGGPATP